MRNSIGAESVRHIAQALQQNTVTFQLFFYFYHTPLLCLSIGTHKFKSGRQFNRIEMQRLSFGCNAGEGWVSFAIIINHIFAFGNSAFFLKLTRCDQ